MAWRETRAATGKFLFVVLSVALGAGALTAVTGFNESVRYTLLREARTLMAADISVRMPVEPSPKELQFLDDLKQQGVASTRVTETVSMAGKSGEGGDDAPVLVSVKAADLGTYPFYGSLDLDPAGTRLNENSVAVSDDLLLRLGLRVGDSIELGERKFRIIARITREPDRMTTGFTLGPRVFFTREGLAATGILVPGSRITERVLLKLPPDHNLDGMRASLSQVFGRRARITDYTETNPQLTRALDRATRFLAMVSLIALIVAGLGVGSTLQSHLRQKMPNIAFMKCIGGRSAHILRIYVTQALLIGLAGSLIGVVIGAFAQAAFANLVASYFDIGVILIWPFMAMLKGIAVGLATAILFALPSLLAIADVKPAFILRSEVSEESKPVRGRRSVIAAAAILAGLWGIAIWVGSSVTYASVFAGVLIGSILVLGALGAGLLRLVRRFSGHSIVRRSAAIRHGIGNLYRPGAHSTAILASLGIGVMFTLSVYFLQHSLLEEIRLTAPPDAPNLFLINITDRERDGIVRLLESETGIVDRQPLSPSVSAQLMTIDGTPLEQIRLEEGARRYLNAQFVLTWARDIPPATAILEGSWWQSQPAEPLVSVQEFAAQALGLKVGSVLEWTGIGGSIRARVANIRRTDAVRIGANNQFILSPGTLDGFSVVYYAAIRVKPDQIGPLQARIFRQFPTVTVINAADILEIIQEVMDRVSLAVRFVAGFAIFGGLVVLASSIAGTRYRRMREVAILRTVGATRGTLVRMFSAEFALLGSAAGLIGGALGAVLSAILTGQLLDTPYKLTWSPVLAAAAITTVLTVITGWLASYGVLDRKPLDILRQIES
ncbi:MAG: FtsX-like permease family protein [Acidobacteria bacterium]|nr:FtsX-like permease family protein [Acidobacteriota bacterium]